MLRNTKVNVCALGSVLGLMASISAAPAQAPSAANAPTVSQRQFVTSVKCQDVYGLPEKPDFVNKSPDERDEILISIASCAAAEHSKANPTDPQVVLVAADPNSPEGVTFKTLSQKDGQKIHDACVTVAKGVFAYLAAASSTSVIGAPIVGGIAIATNNGKTDCDSFVHGAEIGSPLIVLAPDIISGAGVTVHVLRMIGLKKPAAQVQAEVDNVGKQAGAALAKGFNEVKKNPMILINPAAAVATRIPPCHLHMKWHGLKSYMAC